MDIWVFGYGSLMWNPGFVPAEQVRAQVSGYHRSFCMLSIHHRGTETDPGLVLALDAVAGATCEGLALQLPPADQPDILAKLRERELISSAYIEQLLPVDLTDGRTVSALAYVVDRAHRQYCQFDLETQATMIARARGGRGPNTEYLIQTAQHLGSLGIHDPDMVWLADRVTTLRSDT